MRRTAAVLASIVFLVVPASGQPYAVPGDPGVVRYDGYASVRVSVTTPGQMLAVTSLMDMLMSESSGVGTFDVLLAPGKIEALDQLGIDYEVLDPDIQTSIDAESRRLREQRDREQGGLVEPRGGRSWFDDYKDLDAILAQLDAVAASKPQITVVETIGQSLESRPIKAIRITGPGGPGNRPAVFYHGGQHAREWITPMTIMYFADRLVGSYGSDARVTDLLNNVEIILVPVMNPDGYSFSWTNQRLWRKNRRDNGNGTWGVDLNRNWGYQWGGEGASTSPSSETYRGPSPFSEPETQVMRDFITANPRIRVHIDFHSYSQLILSPWGYTSDPPPDASTFNMLNAELKAAVERLYGTPYVAGPTYTTIYPASGGSADWTYGARGILGWAWELRDKGQFGFILPPEQIIPTGQETIECILLLAEYVAYPFVYSFPAPLPATVIAGQTTDAVVEIKPRTGQVAAGSPRLKARVGTSGPFTDHPIVPIGGDSYRATLPASDCNDLVQFYFEAVSTDGLTRSSPVDAPLSVHQAVAYGSLLTYFDPCEVPGGWVVGLASDNATSGIWGLMEPQATAAQPGADHTPDGTKCWVTDGRAGSSIGAYDVDGGTTTLTSPAFDATDDEPDFVGFDAVLSYARWYSNDKGSNPNNDSMPVWISNDDGANWTLLEDVTQNANAWVVKTFRIADFVTPTDRMKLRFQARDLGGGSIVEAAIDDVSVTLLGCPRRPADFNGDGFIDLEDFIGFVAAFEAGDDAADFDGSGFVDTDDFDAFVRAFEEG